MPDSQQVERTTTLHVSDHPLMVGFPGARRPGSPAASLGELMLAQSMHRAGLLARCATFWSLEVPGEPASHEAIHHVDCVVVTGSTLWVLEVRFCSAVELTAAPDGADQQGGARIDAVRALVRLLAAPGVGTVPVRSVVVFISTLVRDEVPDLTAVARHLPQPIEVLGLTEMVQALGAEPPYPSALSPTGSDPLRTLLARYVSRSSHR